MALLQFSFCEGYRAMPIQVFEFLPTPGTRVQAVH